MDKSEADFAFFFDYAHTNPCFVLKKPHIILLFRRLTCGKVYPCKVVLSIVVLDIRIVLERI